MPSGINANWKRLAKQFPLSPDQRPIVAPPRQPNFSILGTPDLVWWTPGIQVLGTPHIESGNNIVRWEAGHNGQEISSDDYLHFAFLFENPSDKLTVINVWFSLLLHGLLSAIVTNELFAGNSTAEIYTRFSVWTDLNLPPSTQTLGGWEAHASGTFWSNDPGNANYFPLNEWSDSSVMNILVDPNGSVVFEVVMNCHCQTERDSDSAGADFQDINFGYQVMCPGVMYSILTYVD
jgi:hypothetical protein